MPKTGDSVNGYTVNLARFGGLGKSLTITSRGQLTVDRSRNDGDYRESGVPAAALLPHVHQPCGE